MLKQHQRLIFCLAYLALSATVAVAQPTEAASNQITLRGKVEAVDTTARTVTIRGDQGNVVTLDVPQSVTRLDQVQVGDVVSVSYYDRVSIRPKPPGEAAVDRTEPPVTTATPGALPGATVATQRVTTVTLTGWDPATRVVTFTGPSGASYQRRLLDTTDAKRPGGAQGGRSRGRDPDRSGSPRGRIADGGASGCHRGFSASVHDLGPLGLGQPVQRQHDSGGERADDQGRADQPERDHLRRRVRPHGELQDWRRLPHEPAQ